MTSSRTPTVSLYATGRVLGTADTRPGRSRVVRSGRLGLGRADSERPTVAPPPVPRTGGPVLVMLVIDESPSERDADPLGHRHLAGRRIVELLRTDLHHPGDRVAVVHFAERPGPWRDPTAPRTRRGRFRLRRALRPTRRGWGTDIRSALVLAAGLVPRRWTAHVVVVLLTDGHDHNGPVELAAAVRRLPPGSVHVVSVGAALPDTWAAVPIGSASVLPAAAGPDEVEHAAAEALYGALGLTASASA